MRPPDLARLLLMSGGAEGALLPAAVAGNGTLGGGGRCRRAGGPE
jgi:hypothetical protein